MNGDRELELWTKAVVDVDDLDADIVANASTPSLLRLQAAKNPSSTMHVEVHGHASFLFRRVDSRLDMAFGMIVDGNLNILDVVDFRTFGFQVVSRRKIA